MARSRSRRFAPPHQETPFTPIARWTLERTWARLLLSALSGVLLAYSFPRNEFEPLVFVAVAPLILAVVLSASRGEAFLQATFSATVTWLINLPWIIKVMSYYGGLPLPVGVILYVITCVALGVFAGVFFGLSVFGMRLGKSPIVWLLVPLSWVTVEYARTWLLSGFPWNQLAAALVDLPAMVQVDRLIGPYGTGFLIMIPATCLAWLLTVKAPARERLIASTAVIAFLALWLLSGISQLRAQTARMQREPRTVVALLQPNISQEMRWRESTANELFLQMMQMTRHAVAGGAKVIIWPESSVPLSYFTTDVYRAAVESVSQKSDVDIILGSVAEDPAQPDRLWNAAYLVSGGRTIGRYDKIKLVPFGEYVPMKKFLFFADKLVHAVGDFQFGTNDHPLVGRFRYGPAICYEIVYPQIPLQQIRNGADVLVTISNDGWYAGTAALPQHLNQARLRAVEGDRYLLRATTSGISAFVEPTGRIVASLGDGREGIIFARFAPRTNLTPYIRSGDWFAMAAVIVVALGLLLRRRAELQREA